MYHTFNPASVIGIILMLGKFPGNGLFWIEIANYFSICWTLHFSVIVINKLLKALPMFIESFNFSPFTSKVGTCSTECSFPVSFNIMFQVFFFLILLLDFAISLLQWWFVASCSQGEHKVLPWLQTLQENYMEYKQCEMYNIYV